MNNNYALIMAGGIGSRFWPMSVPEHPKQFLDILGMGKSLLQMTYERLLHISPSEQIYILTNSDYKDLVLKQLPDLTPDQVLTEPVRKNTAPCIAYAASKIYALNPNACLIISPADHLILNEGGFQETLHTAIDSAMNNRIATIGIAPTRPDTGYGYIEVEKADSNIVTYPVKQFREKPDLETAHKFLQSGNFLWNSGIFIWKASTVLQALESFQPDLYSLFANRNGVYNSSGEQEFVNQAFHACQDISIDYAVMEHADNIDVVRASFDWSDLGTWGSLDMHLRKDEKNNSIIGGNICVFNSANCIVNLENGTEAVIDGLDGYIVIQSENRLMIIRKSSEQDLKNFVKELETKKEG
jgi:mannose-1-phosphate guanylyltransferase